MECDVYVACVASYLHHDAFNDQGVAERQFWRMAQFFSIFSSTRKNPLKPLRLYSLQVFTIFRCQFPLRIVTLHLAVAGLAFEAFWTLFHGFPRDLMATTNLQNNIRSTPPDIPALPRPSFGLDIGAASPAIFSPLAALTPTELSDPKLLLPTPFSSRAVPMSSNVEYQEYWS